MAGDRRRFAHRVRGSEIKASLLRRSDISQSHISNLPCGLQTYAAGPVYRRIHRGLKVHLKQNHNSIEPLLHKM